MSRSTPFLIGKGAGDGAGATPLDAGEAVRSSAAPHTPRLVEQATVKLDFRNSRREGFSMNIDTSEEYSKRRFPSGTSWHRNLSRGNKREPKSRFSAIYSGQSSDPRSRGISVFLPRLSRVPYRQPCAPSCRKVRIPRLCRPDCGISRWYGVLECLFLLLVLT